MIKCSSITKFFTNFPPINRLLALAQGLARHRHDILKTKTARQRLSPGASILDISNMENLRMIILLWEDLNKVLSFKRNKNQKKLTKFHKIQIGITCINKDNMLANQCRKHVGDRYRYLDIYDNLFIY